MHSAVSGDIDRSAVLGGANELGVIGSPGGLMSLVSLVVSKARGKNVDQNTPKRCVESAQFVYWKVEQCGLSGKEAGIL